MRYTFCPADPVWYATDLRLDAARGMLQWTGGRGQDALLVRTPYGVDPETMTDALCAALEQTELREGRFTEVLSDSLPSGTAARLVSALERAKRNGCPIDGQARTYTVFACRTVPGDEPSGKWGGGLDDVSGGGTRFGPSGGPGGGFSGGWNGGASGGERFLYGHQRGEISSPRCDVPLPLRVDVEAVKPGGLLARFAQSRLAGNRTGFYRISFPPRCPEGFRDGDLEYLVDDFAVPVTRRMLEAGSVYVRTDLRPRMVCRTAGLTLEGG